MQFCAGAVTVLADDKNTAPTLARIQATASEEPDGAALA